ncbi:hypothetical protein [Paractinoplanes rishiriensis]|uniref:Uncharacterized protein n=1 Tax=Paractinoplanes rishiriensis TaxID=1050105 RepID=A0A919MT61_9ACTN|nr:hypothetical protein [Actinoplanes rishiriensis]GIE93924.1 hypothetical protein Ari01nite_13890 [Actinoplanes rishiriensis]
MPVTLTLLIPPSLTPTSPPTPAPVLPSATCVPGHDGIPDSVIGHLMCGTWADDAPASMAVFMRAYWPLLLAALALLVAARLGWAWWRRHVWRRHAGQARWLEIVPPVSATPAATVGLWRLLATALPASSRWSRRPHRLVWEVQSDPKGMRCGLWLPPGVNPTAVLRLLQRAWPGARAEQAKAPAFAPGSPVVAVALLPTQPEWLPLVDDAAPSRGQRWEAGAPPEEDRLRAVYDGLAAAGRTGGGLLQVHVTRAPAHRVRGLRRATIHPDRARRPRTGASRAIGLLADALRAVIIGVLDLVTPGPATRKHQSGRADPYLAELARQARGKLAAAPHLLVAVHATATGPTVAAARAAAADITSGFGLLSPHFSRRRLRRARAAATWRWVPASRMTLASVDETAALAGLPAEPSAHGMPAAASRRRPASREVFTAGPAPATRPKRRPAPDLAQNNPAQGDPPTVWSTP